MTKSSLFKYHLEISLFLCLIVPPVGILFLLFIGWYNLHQVYRKGERIKLTPGLFLLSCMFVSTICASVAMNNYSFFLVSALILAYIGMYIKMLNNRLKIIVAFKWGTIFGGIYFYCLYPFQKLLMEIPSISYVTGTALIGADAIDLQNYTRLVGSTYNPNFSVAILLIGLSFLLAECLESLRQSTFYKLVLQQTAVFMFVHAIFLTGSKAGFVIMFFIFVSFLIRWNKWISIVFTVCIAINIPLVTDWMPRSEQLIESAKLRKEIWKNSFSIWQEHSLFGTTPIGFYNEYSSLFHNHVPHAHNMILGVFTEYGALGGIALLFVIFINGYKVIYLYFSQSKNKIHLNVFLLSLPVILLTGVFDYVLFSPQFAFLAIILLASWDQYTAKITLLKPRLGEFILEWIKKNSFMTPKNKKPSNN